MTGFYWLRPMYPHHEVGFVTVIKLREIQRHQQNDMVLQYRYQTPWSWFVSSEWMSLKLYKLINFYPSSFTGCRNRTNNIKNEKQVSTIKLKNETMDRGRDKGNKDQF